MVLKLTGNLSARQNVGLRPVPELIVAGTSQNIDSDCMPRQLNAALSREVFTLHRSFARRVNL